MILALRTDKPEAELYLYDEGKQLASIRWEAHRQLALSIHTKIEELLHEAGLRLIDVTEVAVYAGPGSFTGLRIGISVANALSYSLEIPIAAAEGEGWLERVLADPGKFQPVMPVYGAAPHITQQKK